MQRVQSTRSLMVERYPWRELNAQTLDVQSQIMKAVFRASQSLQHLTRLVRIPSLQLSLKKKHTLYQCLDKGACHRAQASIDTVTRKLLCAL